MYHSVNVYKFLHFTTLWNTFFSLCSTVIISFLPKCKKTNHKEHKVFTKLHREVQLFILTYLPINKLVAHSPPLEGCRRRGGFYRLQKTKNIFSKTILFQILFLYLPLKNKPGLKYLHNAQFITTD